MAFESFSWQPGGIFTSPEYTLDETNGLYEVRLVDVDNSAQLLGNNFESDFTYGSIYTPKFFGSAKKFLIMTITPRNSTTPFAIPSALDSQQQNVRANYEKLVGILRPGFPVLQGLKRVLESGEIRAIECEVLSIKKAVIGKAHWNVAIELDVPSGLWESNNAQTNDALVNTVTTLNGAGGFFDLTPATAPIIPATVLVYGPVTNPKVIDMGRPGNFCYFRYNGTIPDGSFLQITNGMSVAGGGGSFVPDFKLLEHFGDSVFLSLHKDANGLYRVHFTGTATGANTKLRINAARRFA